MSSKPTVIGGKLKLKGDSKSSAVNKKTPVVITSSSVTTSTENISGKKRQKEEDESKPDESNNQELTFLTEAQKRFKQKKLDREKEDIKKLSTTSFRERVEKFNEKLSKLTEHNDIPRVSAAGNG